MLGRPTRQGTEDGLQLTAARTDTFSLTTHKELDTANNNVSLGAVLTDTAALPDTLIAAWPSRGPS